MLSQWNRTKAEKLHAQKTVQATREQFEIWYSIDEQSTSKDSNDNNRNWGIILKVIIYHH